MACLRLHAAISFIILLPLLFNVAVDCKTQKRDVKALNEIKASLGWRVVYAWVGDDPCGDGDLPAWSGVTCSTQGDYRVVTELEVYAVSIIGPFPTAVTNLLDLTRLDLHNNKLTGPIPPQIGHLKRLRVLNLRWNKLQDVIPPEISELKKLTHLYLSFNSFKGEIPRELANLPDLQYLHLHENRFIGRIPAELGTICNLRHLLGHQSERFILGSQARQVFYVQDQENADLSVVGFTPHKMYNYRAADEADDTLEFDATVHPRQQQSLVDLEEDFMCTRPDGEVFCGMYSKSPKDHDDNMDQKSPPAHDDDMDQLSPNKDEDNESRLSRGATIKAKSSKDKVIIKYNKKGVPVGDGATQLATFEGLVARTLVPITYETWHDIDDEAKEDLWQYILMNFEINPKSRKNSLKSIGTKWRNFKHYLVKNHISPFKDDPKAPELLNPPALYPGLKDDWKLFVSQKLSSKFQKKSEKNKKVRAHCKYNHRLSRKGYAGLTAEIMEETGKAEEEIDRTILWKKARELKTGGYTSDVKEVVDKIRSLGVGSLGHGDRNLLLF